MGEGGVIESVCVTVAGLDQLSGTMLSVQFQIKNWNLVVSNTVQLSLVNFCVP